jgi:hypothetical protein
MGRTHEHLQVSEGGPSNIARKLSCRLLIFVSTSTCTTGRILQHGAPILSKPKRQPCMTSMSASQLAPARPLRPLTACAMLPPESPFKQRTILASRNWPSSPVARVYQSAQQGWMAHVPASGQSQGRRLHSARPEHYLSLQCSTRRSTLCRPAGLGAPSPSTQNPLHRHGLPTPLPPPSSGRSRALQLSPSPPTSPKIYVNPPP